MKKCNIENVICCLFDNYISQKRKKQYYIDALYFIFIKVFILIKEIETSYTHNFILQLTLSTASKQFMKNMDYIWELSKRNSIQRIYQHEKKEIKHSFLVKVISELEEQRYFEHENGYCIFTDGGIISSYKLGIEYINFSKIYKELYFPNRSIILKCLKKYKPAQKPKVKPVEIRSKDNSLKYEEISSVEYKSLMRRKVLRESREYINRLRKMYSESTFSLSFFQDAESRKQEEVKTEFLSRYGRIKFSVEVYDRNIELLNEALARSNKFVPYRVFHWDLGKLAWGRIYGNPIDNLERLYKPMILLNGQPTVSVDIKSSLVQNYVLKYHPNVDNTQDFYEYSGLVKYGLKRDDIKSLTMMLLYTDTLVDAFRAYNNLVYRDHRNTRLSYKSFNEVYEIMSFERKYLSNLFLNSTMCKRVILDESNLVVRISNQLMNKNIPHIYNFDAIYLHSEYKDRCLSIFNDVSTEIYGNGIRIETN